MKIFKYVNEYNEYINLHECAHALRVAIVCQRNSHHSMFDRILLLQYTDDYRRLQDPQSIRPSLLTFQVACYVPESPSGLKKKKNRIKIKIKNY